MAKLKNPPPKRVRIAKNLGYETKKFLDFLGLRLMIATTMFDLKDIKQQCTDDLRVLRDRWNTWWEQEKAGRKARRLSREAKHEA